MNEPHTGLLGRQGPDARTGPVDVDAVRALLALLYSQSADVPDLSRLVPIHVIAQHARRFKLDVSMDLSHGGVPRMSVNDTGEPKAFRARLRKTTDLHGVSRSVLDEFLALSTAGDGQTTLSLKWGRTGAKPRRTGLYFEELNRHSDGRALWADVFRWAGCPVPEPMSGYDGAVCVDFDGDQIVGVKDYWIGAGELPDCAPPILRDFLQSVPFHPRTGGRTFLFARRFDPKGMLTGYKLLWMTETTRLDFASRAWAALSDLQSQFVGRSTPVYSRMRRWVAAWPLAPACMPYPDLVSLNCDAVGNDPRLIAYVSLK